MPKFQSQKNKTCLVFRLFYVRHAFDFLKTGFKLLHIFIFVFLGIWILNRNLSWTFAHLLKGTTFHRMPKGIFCMAKNLTEVIGTMEKDQRKEFFQATLNKGKMFVFVNASLYNIWVTFCFLAALKSR